jgi:C4-dicarboxylate-specific signal transduction histidine kinase
LGLTVARVLSEAMGGSLEIDDARGAGCVFRLRLPAA